MAIAFLFLIVALLLSWIWHGTTTYPLIQLLKTSCSDDALHWDSSRPLKVMSYNVQYMASKNYVFFYNVEGGTDSKPSEEHTRQTLDRVAQIVSDENPDVLFVQEINGKNDSRSHFVDQISKLQNLLGEKRYVCQAGAGYWQVKHVLHPKINGSVDMKLAILSKYEITEAVRYQLPQRAYSPLIQRFHIQRALLEARIQSSDGSEISVMTSHFDYKGENTGIMQRQVEFLNTKLQELNVQNIPWVIGGDFNLLPPDGEKQLTQLINAGTGLYDAPSALTLLYENYNAIPAIDDLSSELSSNWYTHYPNDPRVNGPDRTIDYIFYSDHWNVLSSYVRRKDTLDVSDHLPIVTTLEFSSFSNN